MLKNESRILLHRELGPLDFRASSFDFCIEETRLNVGLSIEDAKRLSGMAVSEWMAVEAGQVPQELNHLRAMAEALKIGFEKIASMVVVCRGAWEL